MDLDISTLIYILVTVVAVIAGVAGRKKKPSGPAAASEASDSPNPEVETKKGNFFTKLEEQLESFAADAKQSANIFKEETVVQSDTANFDEAYFEEEFKDENPEPEPEFQNDFGAFEGTFDPDKIKNDFLMRSEGIEVTEALEIINLDDDDGMIYEDLKDIREFDGRTAVIYSSIINRIDI